MNQAEIHQSPRVASVKSLLGVWIALIVGTGLTVGVTSFDLGAFNIWIGLGIATGQAILVALFYMHLRWDKPFNAYIFVFSFAFLGLFIGLALMDTSQNQADMIPDFGAAESVAPEMP